MRILYVVHQYFPECHSGTEQYCRATVLEARRRGHDASVLTLVPDAGRDDPPLVVDDGDHEGCPVLRLRHWWGLEPNEVQRDYQNPLVAARFRQVLHERRPDVVHFFHLRNLGTDLLVAARDTGVRTVVHLMDFWYLCARFTLLTSDGDLCEGPPDGGLGCVRCHLGDDLDGIWSEPELGGIARKFASHTRSAAVDWGASQRFVALIRRKDVMLERLALADAVVAPSRFLAGMFEKNGVPVERMTIVPYGLEPDRVERVDVTRPRDPLRLAFAGVFSPWKGAHVLVDAVRRTDARVRLRLHGKLDMPMFADYVRDLRARAGADPRIEFVGEFGHAELSGVLAETDLLVVPSTWYENTPLVMLEALAAGVPVAVSDLGGMAELVEPGRNGFLFPPGDVDAVTRLIDSWVREPARIADLDPRPRGSIADNFDRFLDLYGSRSTVG